MRDDSLYRLMDREAADAPPASATDDLRRGRRRLRRRRLGVTAAAACGVLVASIAAYGVGGMTQLTGGPATENDGGSQFEINNSWAPAKQSYSRVRDVVFAHTEYGQNAGTGARPHAPLSPERAWRDAAMADSFGYHSGDPLEESWLANVTWDRTWYEDSNVGTLYVDVFSHRSAGRWSSGWMTECRYRIGSNLFPTCEERTTSERKIVLVGIDRRPHGLWIMVKWKQPDGTLVRAGFSSPRWPQTSPPALTIDDLMKVATDPRLTILGD